MEAVPAPPSATASRRETPPAPVVAVSASASASAPPLASALPSATPSSAPSANPLDGLMLHRVDVDFTEAPWLFTASFDGSQRFSMWADTLRFARELGAAHGRPVHLTYFINTCYLDPTVEGSKIGKAESWDEVLVRRALMQIAINEGHDIGNHGVRHDDGGRWSRARWRRELDEFHAVTDRALFVPVRDGGRPVFPRFEATTKDAGRVGSACRRDEECDGTCLAVTARERFCTQPCNRKQPCPAGTACGTPSFYDDTDVCLPVPTHPIVHEGVTLFDAEGHPTPEAFGEVLRPYRLVGFRAPHLASNTAAVEALMKRRYLYEASQVAPPGPPLRIGVGGSSRAIVGFALSKHRGARTIPMDYEYLRAGVSGAVMEHDYRESMARAAQGEARWPWSVGHHFSTWRDGAYWEALQGAMRFAAEGCPDEAGEARCPDVAFVSYRELTAMVHRAVKRDGDVARLADRRRRFRPVSGGR